VILTIGEVIKSIAVGRDADHIAFIPLLPSGKKPSPRALKCTMTKVGEMLGLGLEVCGGSRG
jgi:hypothetical protein